MSTTFHDFVTSERPVEDAERAVPAGDTVCPVQGEHVAVSSAPGTPDRTLLATIVWWALRILAGAAFLDALTTYLAFSHPGAREQNPVARALIDTFGLTGALVLRSLTGVGYLVILGWAFRRSERLSVRLAACIVAVGTAAFWWMVVVNNVTVLAV